MKIRLDKGYSTLGFVFDSVMGVSISEAMLGLGSFTWISMGPLTASDMDWLLLILFLLKL